MSQVCLDIFLVQGSLTCASRMPRFPVRESPRLTAVFVDPREDSVVGLALHMPLDNL